MRESRSGTPILGDPLQSAAQRLLPSDRLLIALIFLVPIMKPAVRAPMIAADLMFVLLVLVIAAETMLGLRRLYWIPAFPPLLGYMTRSNLMPKGTGTTARVNAAFYMRGY